MRDFLVPVGIPTKLVLLFCDRSRVTSIFYFIIAAFAFFFPVLKDPTWLLVEHWLIAILTVLCIFRFVHSRRVRDDANFRSTFRDHLFIVYSTNILVSFFIWSPFVGAETYHHGFMRSFLLFSGMLAASTTTTAFLPSVNKSMIFILGVVPAAVVLGLSKLPLSERLAFSGLMILYLVFLRQAAKLFYHLMLGQILSEQRLTDERNALQSTLIELRRAQELVSESRARAEEASKLASLGVMAGGIAHEINNPLAIMDAHLRKIEIALDTAAEKGGDPIAAGQAVELKGRLLKSRAAIERIVRIVQGLKFFSRDTANDSFNMVDMRSILDATLSLCKERLHGLGIAVSTKYDSSTPYNLWGSDVQLSQVLINLINNSIDAIHDGPGSKTEIHVRVWRDENWNYVRVTDSGPGIPEEIRLKVFDPFFTTKEVGKGTGLGLSLSKGIIEKHGGKLELDAGGGPGASFKISLPVI